MTIEKLKDQTEERGPAGRGDLKEKIDKASDMELALFLAKHIDNPCETEIAPGRGENIRNFYIKEAEAALVKMVDSEAKNFLELKIKEYKK